ncbi:hypothetical protein shim_05490 [Shimia sp. SK013]|uniref:hypothetical protein n=1 Tax=Shimia sp. SK013 TaxID=1389006 RepID=UPI0006B5603E|nr:hypothetical protein [Shimia sp. SK013]KPA22271.1 hypothetical protein shim_05490 [Shimia sp. SK013]
MADVSLHRESRAARRIRFIGIAGWIATCIASATLGRSDLLGAAGAVGLAALLPYVYVEQQKISEELASMKALFGSAYHDINRMSSSEYEELSENEKQQYNETGADIGSAELAYQDDEKKIHVRELILAVLLTLQWAFGAAIYDLCVWLSNVGET